MIFCSTLLSSHSMKASMVACLRRRSLNSFNMTMARSAVTKSFYVWSQYFALDKPIGTIETSLHMRHLCPQRILLTTSTYVLRWSIHLTPVLAWPCPGLSDTRREIQCFPGQCDPCRRSFGWPSRRQTRLGGTSIRHGKREDWEVNANWKPVLFLLFMKKDCEITAHKDDILKQNQIESLRKQRRCNQMELQTEKVNIKII